MKLWRWRILVVLACVFAICASWIGRIAASRLFFISFLVSLLCFCGVLSTDGTVCFLESRIVRPFHLLYGGNGIASVDVMCGCIS